MMRTISRRMRAILAGAWLVTSAALFPTIFAEGSKAAPPQRTSVKPAKVVVSNEVSLYAGRSGIVQGTYVNVGDLVKKGQILLKLDASDVVAELKVKKAQAELARAELQQARLAVSLIEAESKEANRQPAKSDVAKARLELAKAAVTVAEARLAVAQAEIDRAAALVESATFRAPLDGIIARRNVSVGAVVPSATNTAPRPVLVILKSPTTPGTPSSPQSK
jgi:multidrug efflux pump subunit AcrA (membrane-fusion protein)